LTKNPSRKWAHLPNDKTVFYVGNVGYHPNRLGVDYIIREIAPRVLAQISDAIFKVVGASPDQVDSHLHRPSIRLLGISSPGEVQELFETASLFVAPIRIRLA
jgi:glycosyltransferase involved in cell wall biosynthesis